jgi:hypothetical protein
VGTGYVAEKYAGSTRRVSAGAAASNGRDRHYSSVAADERRARAAFLKDPGSVKHSLLEEESAVSLCGRRAPDSFLRATRADDESGSRQSARSEARTNGLDAVEERRMLSEGKGIELRLVSGQPPAVEG